MKWMSTGEAAHQIGCSSATVKKWCDAGHVRSFRTLGGHYRVWKADIDAIERNQTNETNAKKSK